MTLSKSSSFLILVVTSALVFEVGCGTDNSSKNRNHAKHNLQGKGALTNGQLKQLAASKAQRADMGIKTSAASEKQLQEQGTTSTIDEISKTPGVYQLHSVDVFYTYRNTSPIENLSANYNAPTVWSKDSNGQDQVVLGAIKQTFAGKMTANTDSARTIDLPVMMTFGNGWTLDSNNKLNHSLVLSDEFVAGTSNTFQDQLIQHTDQDASILSILATSADTASNNKYVTTLDQGKGPTMEIYVRKISDTEFLIWTTIHEKSNGSDGSKSSGTQDIYRNVYLDYTVVTDAAPAKDAAPKQDPATGDTQPAAITPVITDGSDVG